MDIRGFGFNERKSTRGLMFKLMINVCIGDFNQNFRKMERYMKT